ncbi:MAG: hypothetical protein LBM03_00610 [Erysipelotrichaceae bacterium]|jgi:hypothetical protein|nr:hypothetical protein [Erysipelotrichaceae bacterium]
MASDYKYLRLKQRGYLLPSFFSGLLSCGLANMIIRTGWVWTGQSNNQNWVYEEKHEIKGDTLYSSASLTNRAKQFDFYRKPKFIKFGFMQNLLTGIVFLMYSIHIILESLSAIALGITLIAGIIVLASPLMPDFLFNIAVDTFVWLILYYGALIFSYVLGYITSLFAGRLTIKATGKDYSKVHPA